MKDGRYVILCIDDDNDVLLTLRAIIEGAGFLAEQAMTGEDGLKLFAQVQPDFVLVDLMMEEINAGENFVRELRKQNAAVPVYMLSSVGDSLTMETDPAKLGLSGVFQKPVDSAMLLQTLNRFLK